MSIQLHSDRLQVEIAEPGKHYAGSRFDWTGFVTQVTLDGRHTFCQSESPDPAKGTGGRGLCNEFGIQTPIGFDEANPGGLFPKLGVGLLTRPDDKPYSFSHPYAVTPFVIETTTSPQAVRFVSQPRPCGGYAARLTKEIAVEENRLAIRYRLENTGGKTLATDEYAHNFVAIDNHPIGPDYTLTTAFPLKGKDAPSPGLGLTGNQACWPEMVAPGKAFYHQITIIPAGVGSRWELRHNPSGVVMSETGDFPLFRFALWGMGHTVSPEMFCRIRLPPGQTLSWKRTYEFGVFRKQEQGLT